MTPLAIALMVSLVCLIPKLWLKKLDVWGSCVIVLSFGAAFGWMQPAWWQVFPPVDTTHYLVWSLPIMLVLLNISAKQAQSQAESETRAAQTPIASMILNITFVLFASVYAYLVILPLEKFNTLAKILISLVFVLVWQFLFQGLNVEPNHSQKSPQDRDVSAHTVLPNWLKTSLFASVSISSGLLFFFGSSAQLAQQAMILAVIQVSVLVLFWRPQLFEQTLRLNTWILSALWLNSLLFSSARLWYLTVLLGLLSPVLLKLKFAQKLAPRWQQTGLLIIGLGLQIALLAYVWSQQGQDMYLG